MYEHKDNDYILDSPNTSLDFIEMLGDALSSEEIVDRLNEQDVRIKELESENKMLKTTISRNEAYIKRVTTKGKWSNTGDGECLKNNYYLIVLRDVVNQ